jgi:hypothetical protein
VGRRGDRSALRRALLARDLGDTGPDLQRTFEYALTYDRDTVSRAATALLSRVAPAPAVVGEDAAPERRACSPHGHRVLPTSTPAGRRCCTARWRRRPAE